MAEEQTKKNAFAVLLKNSPKLSQSQPPSSKKRKISTEKAVDVATCPVCSGTFSSTFIDHHVESCLAKSAQKETRDPASTSDSAEPILVDDEANPTGRPAAPEIETRECGPPPAGESTGTPGSDAFSRLMQRQRSQSSTHNFYLEKTAEDSFRWHWFVSSPRSEAALAAQLLPGAQQGQQRAPELSKGFQDPQVKKVYGGQDHTDAQPASERAQSTAAEAGQSQRKNATASSSAQPQAPRGHAAKPEAQGGTGHGESWRGLPPAKWHAMTSLLASKLGGPPKVKVSVRLLTNLSPGEGGDVSWKAQDLRSNARGGTAYHGSISVLKSALQKNIRLCRPDSALRCALHLIKEDVSEFLRRCCIICLEDSLLHPALPLMVWSMAAHAKGFPLGRTVVNRCLAITYHLAHSPTREHLPQDFPSKWAPSMDLFEHAKSLSPESSTLVRAILLRAAYGGMPGDVNLLKGFAHLWSDRFAGLLTLDKQHKPDEAASKWQEHIWNNVKASHATASEQGVAYNVEAIEKLCMDDIPPSAVDFHVSSIIEDMLQVEEIAQKAKEQKKDAAHQLRQSMWKFRSGLSNKIISPIAGKTEEGQAWEELQAFWTVALPHVEAWSKNFLNKRFH